MSISAYFERAQPQGDRRLGTRRKLRLELERSDHSGSHQPAIVHDLSPTGMLMETGAPLATAERFEIEIPQVGAAEARVVWNSGRFYGCKFAKRLPNAALAAAILKASPPEAAPPAPGDGDAFAELQALTERVQDLTDQLDRIIDQLEKKSRP